MVIFAFVGLAWTFGYLVGEQEAAWTHCAFSAPPQASFYADFDGWSWTCVYEYDNGTRVTRPGPSVWDYVRGVS